MAGNLLFRQCTPHILQSKWLVKGFHSSKTLCKFGNKRSLIQLPRPHENFWLRFMWALTLSSMCTWLVHTFLSWECMGLKLIACKRYLSEHDARVSSKLLRRKKLFQQHKILSPMRVCHCTNWLTAPLMSMPFFFDTERVLLLRLLQPSLWMN